MRVAPDADGEPTAQGGLGTTDDPQATAPAATTAPEPPASEPTDLERRYWASLNAEAQQRAQDLRIEGWATATHGPADNDDARLCKVYYFHTDQVGMPEELSNSQGQLVWQASYKTWGSTVTEEWEIKGLAGQRLHPLDQGDTPQSETEKQQNLRFQGQYLDRETGLHYNTFRYYDPDVGRFICPDPIGLDGGINLGSYSPNPIAWIDPWGLAYCPKSDRYRNDNTERYEKGPFARKPSSIQDSFALEAKKRVRAIKLWTI
ncbi:Cell wall-associated polypeptide CWBP200 [Delftia tsuruhatensis]|uniref:RHS repeat-associated core domain-containing protein n=1 Tax=Delftia tsuruhatensis TaxID=180282 RepID=UPI001E7FDF7D|nr:RHS repeat-associated core domain-containing protein [Delftia tsuruhatensis]CAB5723519.1 Cell wall-associated polypeptide CWBP200 [Delftia tsuruhatensis]CAC9693305.1 Cell wall-associated polypeptide CWBP200 [Delftia tsuruhatensis]